MNLNDQGLPLPGRELDEWIAEHIFGRDPLKARHGLHENGDLEYYWGYPQGHDIAPHYSTTHAFFQVMEAMEGFGFFEFFQHDRFIVDWHRDPDKPFDCIRIAIPYLDTLERTFAWGLCAVVWKGKTNEG